MPVTRTFLKSFSSGEISPEMAGRIDDSKYQQGAATMRNFIAKPQGPAENRPGFFFVKEVKDSTKQTRLIPFRFNVSQTMVIEMGQEYFRFHTLGATLQYTDGSAWSANTTYYIGTIAKHNGVNYYAKTNHSGSTPPNSTNWYALPSDMTYEVLSPYQESELFDIKFVQSSDVMTLVHPNHEPAELRRYGATNWQFIDIDFTAAISAPTGLSVSAYMPSSASNNSDTNEDHTYVVTALASDGVRESAASSSVTVSNNIFVTGAKNTITWNDVVGASRYRVYKEQGGLFGFIGEVEHDA